MRYGLLALSLAMLTGGGVAAQSALTISHAAKLAPTADLTALDHAFGGSYRALPFTAARTQTTHLAR